MTILYPVTTEKSVGMIERENKMTFVVSADSTKPEVKKEVEERFKVKVLSVRIMNTFAGKKKAIVRMKKGFKADDIAAKLKIA